MLGTMICVRQIHRQNQRLLPSASASVCCQRHPCELFNINGLFCTCIRGDASWLGPERMAGRLNLVTAPIDEA